MKIKTKLITAFALLVTIPLASTLTISSKMMEDAIVDSFQDKGIGDANTTINITLSKLIESAENYIVFLAGNSDVVQASYYATSLDATADIDALLPKVIKELNLSYLEVINMKGDVISSSISDRKGINLKSDSLVSNALTGEIKADISYNKLLENYQIHTAVQVIRKNKPVAVIHGGYILDKNFLKKIAGNATIALYDTQGVVIASSSTVPQKIIFSDEVFSRVSSACNLNSKSGDCRSQQFSVDRDIIEEISYLFVATPIVMTATKPIGIFLVAQDATEMNLALDSALNTLLLTGLMFIIIAVSIGYFSANSIVKPILKVSHMIHDIASGGGDLTQRVDIKSNDEIGELAKWFNLFISKLQDMITEVSATGGPLNDTAAELINVASNTEQQVAEQQDRIAMVATAINEMLATVAESAKHAERGANATAEAEENTANGKLVLSSSIDRINKLADEVSKIGDMIHKLHEDSTSVGTVLDVIKNIAEQTNLLALNAAIEAARAGEQGRGFAVVADEVRMLAQRTAVSTQEIQEIIERLQSRATDAVEVMSSSKDMANDSVEQANAADDAFSKIASAVTLVNDMATHTASAAEEQNAVVESINEDISNISLITEKTSEAASFTKQQSEQITHLSSKLSSILQGFKV